MRDLTDSESILTILIICCVVNYYRDVTDDNQTTRYGEISNLPANCRSLIAENLSEYTFSLQNYTFNNPTNYNEMGDYIEDLNEKAKLAQDGLYSIERNCGRNGILWDVTTQNKKFFN